MGRKEAIYQLLDTVGDGTGTTNVNGDYSSTPQGFKIKHDKGYALIERMIIGIEDSGSMDSGAYGNGLGLTYGVNVYLRDKDDNILEQYNTFAIKTNADWAMQCHDVTRHAWGAGNEVLSIRWTFSKAGQPIGINFDAGEYFEVLFADDLTDLVKHYFSVQGKFLHKKEVA